MAAELFEMAKTGVFWDAADCKISSGLNAVLVSKSIQSGLQDTCYLGLTSIFAYGSTEDIMVGFDSSAGKVVYRTTAGDFFKTLLRHFFFFIISLIERSAVYIYASSFGLQWCRRDL